jgi:feruloyl esterase
MGIVPLAVPLLLWSQPAGDPAAAPGRACASLRALTGYEFSVTTATLTPAAGDVPEYCRVTGQILPEIRFEVNLPTSWNRRFYMSGNGGYAGEPLDSPMRARQREQTVRAGFASAVSNTGHDAATEPLATFALNSQKLLDYAFRSLHVTAVTAKRIITAYYGNGPVRSYYEGCSTGGRQGLILAQRFPEDFDGIIAGAPVLNFSGTMTGYACAVQALEKAPIPYGKLPLLAGRVYAQCDERDGLKDGLIDDPRRCDFQPSRDLPRCAQGADSGDCFTPAQIATLETIYGDVTGGGRRLFPGWPVSAEAIGPNGRSGWDNWIVRQDGGTTTWRSFGETFFRYMAFPEKNPNYDITTFDFDKDPPRMDAIRQILDATDPDLSAFRARGGRLLMYFGWADPALNARMGVEYYESVLAKMGEGTRDFFRLFMAPGMFHCSGGVGPNSFDALGAMRTWVEQGLAPDRIEAAQSAGGKGVRTRPRCPYPQVARYNGSGSVDEAANFTCRLP